MFCSKCTLTKARNCCSNCMDRFTKLSHTNYCIKCYCFKNKDPILCDKCYFQAFEKKQCKIYDQNGQMKSKCMLCDCIKDDVDAQYRLCSKCLFVYALLKAEKDKI